MRKLSSLLPIAISKQFSPPHFKIPSSAQANNIVPSLKSLLLYPYLPDIQPLALQSLLHPVLYVFTADQITPSASSQFVGLFTFHTLLPCLANLAPPSLSTSLSESYSIFCSHHFWNLISCTPASSSSSQLALAVIFQLYKDLQSTDLLF